MRRSLSHRHALQTTLALVSLAACQGPPPRITQPVNDADTLEVPDTVHPSVQEAQAPEPAPSDLMLEHMVLHLQGSDEQEAKLQALIAAQIDPQSPDYRHYLTPQEYAARFGSAAQDMGVIISWLEGHGLRVDSVPSGGRSIVFSGRVADVSAAFKTPLVQYDANGARHLANAANARIPAAFAGVVAGVVKLHDFEHGSTLRAERLRAFSRPEFAPSGLRSLVPGDYHTIYGLSPLLASGIDGAGVTIAVLARSNIYMSDVHGFRSAFGLKDNDPKIVVTQSDPGIRPGDVVETTLDTEWAGATAPGATVKVIVSASTQASDGIDLSALYAVNNNVAQIITVSYGSCEAAMSATQLSFYDSLWKQAAAQGQSVLVASGDSGAAGCDPAAQARAQRSKSVNGLCSSPYATCVGGTQLVEGANPAQYWFAAGPDASTGSAKGYIPEAVWNESGVNGLWASGGGASTFFQKPAWQTGLGVPADGKRDVPDVSLTAAMHDGYTVIQGGAIGFIMSVAGTSAAAPSLAGIMALVAQKTQTPLGAINPLFYALAAKQALGGPPVFHDITSGNNSVPGLAGYTAGRGYDLATGLGSVDANLLATVWNFAASRTPLTVYGNALSVNKAQTQKTTLTTAAAGLQSDVTLTLTDVPTGLNATLSAATVKAPGSGSVTLTVTAAASMTPGIYSLTVNASAQGTSASTRVAVTVTEPTFTLSYGGGLYPSVNFGPRAPYANQTITLQTQPANGFNAPIKLAATGLPSGMTVAFSSASLSGTAVASSVATVSASPTIKGGNYHFTITASGGGVTRSVTYSANVFVEPSCSLSADTLGLAFPVGGSATVTLSCTTPVARTGSLSVSVIGVPGGGGLPNGVTAALSSTTLTPGGKITLTLRASNTLTPSTYPITVITNEPSGATQMVQVYAAIGVPTFKLTLNPTTVTARIGQASSFTAVVTPDAGFARRVTVWIGSRPVGVSASFTPNTIGNPSSVITLTVDKTAKAGVYPLTLGAIDDSGFSRTVTSTLTLKL